MDQVGKRARGSERWDVALIVPVPVPRCVTLTNMSDPWAKYGMSVAGASVTYGISCRQNEPTKRQADLR